MYRIGGYKLFFAGTQATVYRDLVFGGVYALIRHSSWLDDKFNGDGSVDIMSKFWNNVIAAFAATILSSPLNYVRNIRYAQPPDQQAGSSLYILRELWRDAKEKFVLPKPDASSSLKMQLPVSLYRLLYLQHRLQIGWGTTRVAVGMACASQIYEKCVSVSLHALTTA
jgi:hypothetical protein